MKKYIIKLKILCIIISKLLIVSSLSCQNVEQTIELADAQHKLGNYAIAIKEYQRALFFSKGNYNNILCRKLGDCYFEQKEYSKASKQYEFSYFNEDNDSIKNELVFKKTTCCLLSGNYYYALIELLSLPDTLPCYFNNRKEFYLGVTYFGLENFDQSKIHFLNCLDSSDTGSAEAIAGLFRRKNLYTPNPKTALWFSLIIPGSGQLYSGDIKNGINSLLLCAGLFTLGVDVVIEYSVPDAITGVLPWYQRYYMGGYQNARDIARQKREKKRNDTYRQILSVIGSSLQ